MENINEVLDWLREVKGITKIDILQLTEYIPEFKEWKSNNNLKKV